MLDKNIIDAFFAGHCIEAYKVFGAHFVYEKVNGVRFTVYAPSARSVQVAGEFNGWNGNSHWMGKIDDRGIWSIFIPDIKEWTLYKYLVESIHGQWLEKADPYGFYHELRPNSASIVSDLGHFSWNDSPWLASRSKSYDRPLNIYEIHLGSWKKRNPHEWMNYEKIADYLIPYLVENGFTHVEIMPLAEYPFDGSWGYQATGFFSVTSRYGTPKQFMELVNRCHQNHIGVIMDIVPAHFVKDSFGLIEFDGTALYEYRDSNAANSEWDTLYFDYWKEDVRSFFMSSAAFWCDRYHIDGLRMDAISHLIYWNGKQEHGENEGSLAFLRRMNYYLSTAFPAVILIAEDSSDYFGVTKPTFDMGLGFDYKWDLGWMNDTLRYYKLDPYDRRNHHNVLTFSMAYFYTERFLLPLSHDEVVHGKLSVVDRMWGNYNEKFAQLKNLYVYMFTHPGKKLNFMGNEWAHFREWDENTELDWFLLGYTKHNHFARFFRDISHIYKFNNCLSYHEYQRSNFAWIDADNALQSLYSFYRQDGNSVVVTVLNMTGQSYDDYVLGVPEQGIYTEILNSEKDIYDGCNMTNYLPLPAEEGESHGLPYTIKIRIAPFAGILFSVKKSR